MNYKILSVETREELYDFSKTTDEEAIIIFFAKVQKWTDKSGENLTGEFVLKEKLSGEYERHIANN